MKKYILLKKFSPLPFFLISLIILNSCGNNFFRGADARKVSPDPRERVKKNLEEGKGFRLDNAVKNRVGRGGNFEFASSNELWRASLDIIEFMPLTSANYSGGIIITDWYSNNTNPNETIKITIRFLSNEIRSDAIDINVFYKKCDAEYKCVVQKSNKNIEAELRREILKKAAIYQKQTKAKNKSYYPGVKMGND
tara:strand:- start:807 stop:1391 length:585 start_codon:yes stop_codon:yes gene_type:complete